MAHETAPSAGDENSAAIIDPLHLYDRVVHLGMGLYLMGVGGVQIWRSLTDPDAILVGQLLQGIFFALLLGPLAIYWFGFQSRSTARAIPIGRVKRIVGSLAALAVTVFGLAAMWMAIVHPEVRDGVPPGVDWDAVLGPTTFLVLGLYGLYALAVRGVDVV